MENVIHCKVTAHLGNFYFGGIVLYKVKVGEELYEYTIKLPCDIYIVVRDVNYIAVLSDS